MKATILAAALCSVAFVTSAAEAGIQFTYGPVVDVDAANDVYGILLYASTDVPATTISVTGVDLIQIINNGGTTFGNMATPPVFTFATVKPTDGLFANFPESQTIALSDPQALEIRLASIGTPPQSVTLDNTPRLLAAIGFDATGLIGNTFTLSNFAIIGTDSSVSSFSATGTGIDLPVNPTTATITIPEPASLAFVGLAALGLTARRRWMATA